MRLPKNLLNKGTYTKPRLFLCEVDKTKICELEVIDLKGSFKFNSLSEITFEVPRIYTVVSTGDTLVNPYYNKIEALRLIYLENFGYFELQGPELVSDGIKESKSCTAYSLEYILSQKYLDNFYVNTGEKKSIEVIYAESHESSIVPVTLYNPSNVDLSLLHLILEKVYGWKIGHVDYQLQTLSRQFEVDRESVYDFIINEICEKFNCYAVFDTINNTINLYAESPTSKFIGDGTTNVFQIGSGSDKPLFSSIETVSIGGYKTTRWTYGIEDNVGVLVLEDTPESGAIVEVVGVDSTWETNVFITFENLAKEINVNYNADDIKTVLTVTYGDDYDIRETNLGLPYLTDISYYYNVDWMGQDLYDAYTAYMEKSNRSQSDYTKNSQEILKINDKIYYEEYRLSLEYSLVASVNSSTVGTYYIRTENSDGSFYYTEVSLPSEYKADTKYYSNVTTNLNEDKVENLYSALKSYFLACYNSSLNDAEKSSKMSDALDELEGLSESFEFMKDYDYDFTYLHDGLKNATSNQNREDIIYNFLSDMWKEVGRWPLKSLYLDTYNLTKEVNDSHKDNNNYGNYYTSVLFTTSIEKEIAQRDVIIKRYTDARQVLQDANKVISDSLLLTNNFNDKQLIRLNAFLREDELHLDDIVQTSTDNLSSSFKIKQDAMETGRIELKKLCQPQLQFSMDMDNIYAISEFAPIIDHFQLGRIIRVGLRSDYIKQSRLLQIDINFEDLSDFSVEFGELTSLRTQSDIHADLLKNAISAGKSVATNSSYWTKGSDQATATDIKIQNGLLDAVTQIKAMDGTQATTIDKYGIHLRKKKDGTDDEYEDEQGWIVNNQFLYSDDAFKTSKSVFGKYRVPTRTTDNGEMEYEDKWGLLAEAVIAGYIEGSKIFGGTINIGDLGNNNWAFKVDENGNVSMLGGAVQFNMSANENGEIEITDNPIADIKNEIQQINASKMYKVQITSTGPLIIRDANQEIELKCTVTSWDKDVTNTLDASLFKWKRVSNDEAEDDIWNNDEAHIGKKSITINSKDIVNNATFTCELEVKEQEG